MTTTEQPVDCVTALEAARMLGVTRNRVYALVNKGQLPGIRPWPYHLLIPRQAVEERVANTSRVPFSRPVGSIASTALRNFVAMRIEDDPAEATPAIVKDLAYEFITQQRPEWSAQARHDYAATMSTRWAR